MQRRNRFLAAIFLAASAAIGVAERAALHAHPLEENDLVPHELMLVESAPDCSRAAHFDAARRGDHPICVECSLAASSLAVGRAGGAGLAVSAPPSVSLAGTGRVCEAPGRNGAPARAPPSA